MIINNFQLLKFPKDLSEKDYEELIKKSIEHLSQYKFISSIYTIRNINHSIVNAPGISDIDLVYVVDEEKIGLSSMPVFWKNLTENEKFIFQGALGYPLTQSLLNQSIFYGASIGITSAYHIESGEDATVKRDFINKDELLWCKLFKIFQSTFSRYALVNKALTQKKILVRHTLKRLKATQHNQQLYHELGLFCDDTLVDRAKNLYNEFLTLPNEDRIKQLIILLQDFKQADRKTMQDIDNLLKEEVLGLPVEDSPILFSLSWNQYVIFSDELFYEKKEDMIIKERGFPFNFLDKKIFKGRAPYFSDYIFIVLPKSMGQYFKIFAQMTDGPFSQQFRKHLLVDDGVQSKNFLRKSFLEIVQKHVRYCDEYWAFCLRHGITNYMGSFCMIIIVDDAIDKRLSKRIFRDQYCYGQAKKHVRKLCQTV